MNRTHPENHPNGYTSRQLAFADARIAIGKLCAQDRSPAYKAAIAVSLRALEAAAMVCTERTLADPSSGQSKIEVSDREQLLYIGRVLRAIADLGRDSTLGALWSEAVIGARTIRRVLGISNAEGVSLGLEPSPEPGSPGSIALGALMAGWQEAAVGWGSCASIHRAFARGKDPLFATRQQEFNQRAKLANEKCSAITGPVPVDVAG
jgi:hypothetical protein